MNKIYVVVFFDCFFIFCNADTPKEKNIRKIKYPHENYKNKQGVFDNFSHNNFPPQKYILFYTCELLPKKIF